MVIYLTKETISRYGISLNQDLDEFEKIQEQNLFHWGGKIFYLGGKKCIQLLNFASKLCICLFFINKKDLADLEDLVFGYLKEIYKDDFQMTWILDDYYKDMGPRAYGPLKDRRVIASLNKNQLDLIESRILDDYVEDYMVQTIDFNNFINTCWVSDMVNGKREYIKPEERFAELLKEYYRNK